MSRLKFNTAVFSYHYYSIRSALVDLAERYSRCNQPEQMLSARDAHLSNGGIVDAKDTRLRLKRPKTREHAYEQLKKVLSNSDISAAPTSREVYNAICYVASHPEAFTERKIFTVIDLALSFTVRQRKAFLRRATVMSTTVASGLNLFPNMKALTSCKGTYARLIDLLGNGTFPKSLNCEIFRAMQSIASRSKVFTHEQYCKIVDLAIACDGFSVPQKELLRMWKIDRPAVCKTQGRKIGLSGVRTTGYHVIQKTNDHVNVVEKTNDRLIHQSKHHVIQETNDHIIGETKHHVIQEPVHNNASSVPRSISFGHSQNSQSSTSVWVACFSLVEMLRGWRQWFR